MSIEPFITARYSPYLCSENIGLGNVLFQIAAIYGISKKYKLQSYYNTVIDYCNIIKSRFNICIDKTVLRNFQTPTSVPAETPVETIGIEWDSYGYHTDTIQTCVNNPTKHYIIKEYLENTDYFNEYYDEIKSLYSPTDEMSHSVRELIPKMYDSSITPVSIHFRYLWNSLSDDYYKNAVAYIKERVPNPHFFLFCDTSSAVHLKEIGLDTSEYTQVKLTPQNIDVELYAIGQCSHHIVSQSTFCFWGVYLNRNPSKIVIKSNNMHMRWYGEACVSI